MAFSLPRICFVNDVVAVLLSLFLCNRRRTLAPDNSNHRATSTIKAAKVQCIVARSK